MLRSAIDCTVRGAPRSPAALCTIHMIGGRGALLSRRGVGSQPLACSCATHCQPPRTVWIPSRQLTSQTGGAAQRTSTRALARAPAAQTPVHTLPSDGACVLPRRAADGREAPPLVTWPRPSSPAAARSPAAAPPHSSAEHAAPESARTAPHPRAAATKAAADGDAVQQYLARANQLFVNPFNGRATAVNGPVARRLGQLGFARDERNPLHLVWMPDTYFRHFTSALQRVQACAAHPLDSDAAMAEALSQVLRPFEGRAPPAWHRALSELFRRQDAWVSIPQELSTRYRGLVSAYMPPRLDAVADPAVAAVEMTPDQENVVQLALRGYHLFVGGSAGTGKTVLLKSIHRRLSQLGLRVAMTATTGVAAVQLGGCTFHRAFGVPVHGDTALPSSAALPGVKPAAVSASWDVNALRAVDVVIVDEVSLMSARLLDAFDMEARLARMHFAPFGGIQVVICGDFLQLSNESALGDLPLYESEAFRELIPLQLVTPMRHVEGDPLLSLLRQLRRGHYDAAAMAALDHPLRGDQQNVTYVFPRRREAQVLNDEKLAELQTAEMAFTPQRGPLQLVSTFTPAAFIGFPTAALPLPAFKDIVQILKEELAAELREMMLPSTSSDATDGDSAGDGASRGKELLSTASSLQLADHDVVVMPARASTPAILLRLRVSTDATAAAAAAAPTAIAAASSSAQQGRRRRGRRAQSPALSPALQMSRSPQRWLAVANRVAARLRGRVLRVYEAEPAELVPLSVSLSLADTASGDVTETLLPVRLKLGCRVMVNRNLSRTVSNGSVGVVEAFAPADPKLFPSQTDVMATKSFRRAVRQQLFPRLPVVRLLSGEVVQIPPIATLLGGTSKTYYYAHETFTLPLQLGYGFTVHKVQGLTLQGAVVLDCQRFFECPHLIYVACSRVRRIDQLIVRNWDPSMILVKRSALAFSDALLEANNPQVLSVPATRTRAAWAMRFAQPVYPLAD